MSARRGRGALCLSLGLLLAVAQAGTVAVPPVSAADPTPTPSSSATPVTPPPRLFGRSNGTTPAKTAATGPATPVPMAGFADTIVMSGLTRPIAIRFASDGNVFVAEKSGLIKKFSSLTDTSPVVVADLRSEVHDYWDRGLLGFTLDPNYPSSPYAYVLYAYDAPIGGTAPTYGDGCPKPPGANTDGCLVSGRLSRLTISGAGSTEQVLINDWCQQFPSHSVGDLRFGADGALYATGGDGASWNGVDFGQFGGTTTPLPPTPPTPANPCGDPPTGSGGTEQPPAAEGGALRAQSARRAAGEPVVLGGTVIRVDPTTGAALPDNPLSASSDVNEQRIVGYGLRNPFRFAIRPGTNDLWIGNVGWNTWEAIDRVSAPLAATVSNFGWPCYEGPNPESSYQAATLASCQTLAGSAVVAPYFAYTHASAVVPGETCPTANGSSISGLTFYAGGSYPAAYDGALLFADHTRNCIWAMFPGSDGLPDPTTIQTFVAGASNPVDLETGPGGDLFYVDHEGGAIHRVTVQNTTAPTARITAVPTAGATPLTVDFDGAGSTDPNPGTLTYAWDLDGDGTFGDSTSPTPTWTYDNSVPVTVGLRVTDSFSGLSGSTTTVISPGVAPSVTIDSPGSSLKWAVGDTIHFSGHATDGQGHPIPTSGLSWSLIVHHCPSSCHTHLVQTFEGVASGSFAAPDHEYPSYLELQLTATDSTGLQATRSVLLQPKTVVLSFQSSPVGLALAIATKPATPTPFSVTEIQGSAITLNASQVQTLNTVDYAYEGWSDGGVQSHTITAATSATYTATYVFTATFHALSPTRLLDTRDGNGLSGTFKSHVARTFQVTGRGGVPSGAVAVTGNLTVTGQAASGYLFIGPNPINNPTSSTLNFPKGDNRANGVTVALSGTGRLSITATTTTQAIFDVTGYFTADATGSSFHALSPTRLLDTRDGNGLSGTFKSHVARTFQVTGRGGVPSGAVAVTGNLTVTGQAASGYLFIGPNPINNPTSSTLNFPKGDNRANGVTVAVDVGGTLSVTYVATVGATTQAIFDVTGYFTADATGSSFHALSPTRLLDTRDGNGLSGTFKSHVARTFHVTGRGEVPSGAVAVTGNLTVTGQTARGYLFIGPLPTNSPTSSTLNFPKGDDRANGVTVAVDVGGTLSVTYVATVGATTQAIFDVSGYFGP